MFIPFCKGQTNAWHGIEVLFLIVYLFVCFLKLDEGTPPEPEGSFVDYQTSMVKYSKGIAVTAQEMVNHLKKLTLLKDFGNVALR